MALLENLKIGSNVIVWKNHPTLKPTRGQVVVINDVKKNPGKHIGVKLFDHHPLANSLEGAVDEGMGWWCLPEHLEVIPEKSINLQTAEKDLAAEKKVSTTTTKSS